LSWCLCSNLPNPGLITRTTCNWSPIYCWRTSQGTEYIHSQCTQSQLKARKRFRHFPAPLALD
jgi:hypothetical protein